ncbi:ABC transporter permease, partial [Candidatus Pacearchaeota archaeon]
MLADYFNFAVKNVRQKKLRSFLTLSGITISVATLFILVALSLGLQVAVQQQFETFGTDKFFIQPRGEFGPLNPAATAATLTEDDMKEVAKVPGVKDVTGYVLASSKVEFKNEVRFTNVIGVNPGKMKVAFGSYDVQDGRFLKESDKRKALLGYSYKYGKFFDDEVDVGAKILVNDKPFRVVGIVESVGNSVDDRNVYLPLDEFRKIFDVPDKVDVIVVQVEEPERMDEVSSAVEKKLMKFRDVDEKTIDFSIVTPEEALGAFSNVLNIITAFLLGVATISLIVGGINIANTMLTSVIERTKEIGVMKAIGARNSDVLAIFVIEAGLL